MSVVACSLAVVIPVEAQVIGGTTSDAAARAETAGAPGEQIVRVAGSPAFPGRGELWARRVARALRRGGAEVVTPAAIEWDRPGIDEARLVELEEIEAALGVARRAQASLEEAEAMRALSAASRRARELLDVPGAAAWLAEVEVVTAIVAAQRGETSLAEASLRRALALAPDRALEEGEASPELVARSVALMREEVRRARVPVRVEGTAAEPSADAQVFVDDRAMGALPRELELAAGLHVVRLEARGHRPYARLVDLAPGSRAPLVVSLAPSAATSEAALLDAAVASGDAAAVAMSLDRMLERGGVARAVWLVHVGTGPLDRALVVRCGPGTCDAPHRIDDAAVLTLDAASPLANAPDSEEHASAGLDTALAWLDEVPLEPPPPPPSLLEEWWLWAGVGALLVGGAVTIGIVAQPAGEPPLVLRFDPCTSCASR